MERVLRTQKGIAVSKRCDHCGTRVCIASDDGEKCTLKCSKCGREYTFYSKSR